MTQPELESEQENLTAAALNPTEFEETEAEYSDISNDKIPQLDGPTETPDDGVVTLELDSDGYIVGPKLIPKSSPPAKVFHPKIGIGTLHGESCNTPDKEAFFTYLFPDDPQAYVVSEGPNKGQKIASICEVFLCN